MAIERTTGVIENGVQEVLELAQQTIDAASFRKLLETPGRSNKDMPTFVAAFRAPLAAKDETGDDVLYDILRSFSVLTFDSARPNSMAEHHDRLRARHLVSEKSGADLYDSLFGLVLRADAIGGGNTSYFELLIAQQTRINLIEAQAQRLVDSAAFYQAMGGRGVSK